LVFEGKACFPVIYLRLHILLKNKGLQFSTYLDSIRDMKNIIILIVVLIILVGAATWLLSDNDASVEKTDDTEVVTDGVDDADTTEDDASMEEADSSDASMTEEDSSMEEDDSTMEESIETGTDVEDEVETSTGE